MTATIGRRGVAAAGLAGAIALAVAACGGSGEPAGAPSGGAINNVRPAQLTTGTARGALDSVTWWGGYRPIYSMDPLKLADYPEELAIANMCESVVRVSPDYSLSPGLASAYTFTDPTHLRLTVRQGVRFSDGSPMTAEDVAYSLNRNMDPKVASNYASNFTRVASIRADGANTVVVTFRKPTPYFPTVLATLAGAVVKKSVAERAGQSFGSPKTGVVCTGPYKFGSYDGTSRLVLERFDGYWDTTRRAHVKTFRFEYTTDPSALANALKTGRIDGAFDFPSALLTDLKGAGNGKAYVGGAASTPINIDLLMTSSSGTAADPRVRRALSMVIDRKAIAKTIFLGAYDPLYKVAGPGSWPAGETGYRAGYQEYVREPDVNAARALVSQAGATGRTVTLGYDASDPQIVKVATVIQQEAGQAGLKLKIVGLPAQQYGTLFSDPRARRPYDMIFTRNYVELPDPLLMDMLYGQAKGGTNFSGYDNPVVEAAVERATRMESGPARAAQVLKAEAQLAEDLPSIPIVQPRALVYENARITGATLTFSYMTSPWAAAIGAP